MRIAKIAATTATTAALALGLAACGSSEPEAKPDANASAASSGPKFAGQTLTVWRLGDPNDVVKKYQDELDAEFKKLTGADVKQEWIPWPQVNDKFTAAAAGGAGPDVTEIGNDQVPIWQSQDALKPITDVFKSSPDLSQIPENLRGLETIDGEIYAAPWGGGTRAVLYRKDWFQELKIEVPKTWDELIAAAKKIQEKKGKDVDGFAFNGGTDANHLLGSLVWSLGGDYAARENGKWVGKLNDPAFKEGFDFYTNLVAKEGVSSKSRLTQNSAEIRVRFSNSKVGMYLTAPWDIATIKEESKGKVKEDNLSFFSLPSKDGSGPAPSFLGGNDIAVWGDTKNAELAGEYLKLAAGKVWGTKYAKEGGFLPVYADELSRLESDPVQGVFASSFAKAKAFPADSNWTEANETKAVLQNAGRSVIEGKKDAAAALAEANKELEEILNQ
ncbi:N,N'-diacetylchitobiose transport system substrate-binding protein [Sinosporangium album]|uniref:N,N'-diacetylchitobiose transport system substrate-binding protein n=1 Tax=Sinosporangium album TaxID=504805 RepID=A0A1G7RZX2_9ACTN|nr:extracellular solute-binding protein [Sinosporangium album]SDG15759.1 N,N'-diacetylchitobiose transport system substrate-binding protein [Sinosporangium album]